MGVLARSLAIKGMLTSTKSLENHETDEERCILSRKVYLKATGKGFHTKPSPTLGSLPAGLKPVELSLINYFDEVSTAKTFLLKATEVAWL